MSDRLLEHAALLEGMLDRLRYSCVETRGPERNLVARLYRASGCCTLSVLGLLTRPKREPGTAPLVWHELLLNSSLPVELRVDALQRSLQHMCRLLEEFDTKSTNLWVIDNEHMYLWKELTLRKSILVSSKVENHWKLILIFDLLISSANPTSF